MPSDERPFNSATDYPVAEQRPELVRTATGRRLAEVTLDAVLAGAVSAADLRITPEALERQALDAEAAGRPQLAPNFRRAAELTRVPDDRLLAIYEALRPGRATAAELEATAAELERDFAAPLSAALVREAADVYARRGLLADRA
jgi:propanediol dehydratase small subunit